MFHDVGLDWKEFLFRTARSPTRSPMSSATLRAIRCSTAASWSTSGDDSWKQAANYLRPWTALLGLHVPRPRTDSALRRQPAPLRGRRRQCRGRRRSTRTQALRNSCALRSHWFRRAPVWTWLGVVSTSPRLRNARLWDIPSRAAFAEGIVDAFYDGMKHRPQTTFGTFNDDILAFKDPAFERVNIRKAIFSSRWKRDTHRCGQHCDRGD